MMAVLEQLAQVLIALGVFLNAVLGLLSLFQSRRNGHKIEQVRRETNGLTTKLVEASVAAALSEGTAIGLERGRSEALKDVSGS